MDCSESPVRLRRDRDRGFKREVQSTKSESGSQRMVKCGSCLSGSLVCSLVLLRYRSDGTLWPAPTERGGVRNAKSTPFAKKKILHSLLIETHDDTSVIPWFGTPGDDVRFDVTNWLTLRGRKGW